MAFDLLSGLVGQSRVVLITTSAPTGALASN
jgi:hypothetical protein